MESGLEEFSCENTLVYAMLDIREYENIAEEQEHDK